MKSFRSLFVYPTLHAFSSSKNLGILHLHLHLSVIVQNHHQGSRACRQAFTLNVGSIKRLTAVCALVLSCLECFTQACLPSVKTGIMFHGGIAKVWVSGMGWLGAALVSPRETKMASVPNSNKSERF